MVQIGASSRDIRLEYVLPAEGNKKTVVPDYKESAPGYYTLTDGIFNIEEEQFKCVYGEKLLERESKPGAPVTANSMLGETTHKFASKRMLGVMKKQIDRMIVESDDDAESGRFMIEAMLNEMPIRAIGILGGDRIPKYFTEGFVSIPNGKF